MADQGFLLDPESEYATYYTTDVVSFEAIANIPCLVLLGEPGIGKSTTLRAEFEKIRQTAEAANEIWSPLRSLWRAGGTRSLT